MRRLAAAAALFVVLAGAAACARRIAPEPLPLDRYTCARCGMMISEIGDAAEYVSEREETRYYDDLGCAADDAGRVPIRGRFFVRADGGSKWIAAEDAFFAKTGERTPMGHGFFAFSTAAQAKARDAQGRVRRWADLASGPGERRNGK
ncbi:MAG TPA: hypothetical protein VFS34_15390 [Thermoanaerobaculia bacterium]|nr:hypothetical protein [Thermoanaerobaculia bacterium]